MSDRPDSAIDYKPISDYGVIGDMHSAALVGLDGSIDWYCAPRFDSPSVFAALLDARKGGRFQLSPIESFTTKQSYEGETNVLSTIFESKQGRIRLTELSTASRGNSDFELFSSRVWTMREERRQYWRLEKVAQRRTKVTRSTSHRRRSSMFRTRIL